MSRRQEVRITELEQQVLKLEMEKAELTDEVKRLGGDLESLVERVPSAYLNPRGDEWRIEQFNRNRAPEDQVHSIQEMSDRVEELFGEKVNPSAVDGWEVGPWEGMVDTDEDNVTYIYESPDGGKTLYRRKMLDYDNREKMYPNPAQLELFKDC